MKTIVVHNPDNLKTAPYTDFVELQGDLKTLPSENLEKLKNSILGYGIRFPFFIWVSEDVKYIVDAHQRKKVLAIFEKEGYTIPGIPYITIIAKNRKEAGALLLQANSRYGVYNEVTTFFEDFDIDLSFINDIEIPELDIKLEELEPEIVEDEVPEPPAEPLSKTGDLWCCGRHRVLCGDATREADISKLMDGKKADMVFMDPPYGNKLGYGRGQLGERYIIGDENLDMITKAFPLIDIVLRNNSHCLIFSQWRTFCQLSSIFDKYSLRTVIIWDKKQAGLSGGGFAEQHEWICVFIKGKATQKEYSGNVWQESRENQFEGRVIHPTMKPVKIVGKGLSLCSKENDLIADFFLGSGTTLIACIQTNRILYGTELDPHYVDVILDRYAKFTGDDPVRESDNVKWSELKRQ